MVPLTRRLRFLVAVRPGLNEPAMSARMAATLDRLSEGWLLINVAAGGDPAELRGDGVWLDHDARYAATDEFLRIWRRLIRGETVDFRGQHMAIEGGKLLYPPPGAGALSAALLRRLVAGRAGGGGGARGCLPDLGRAAGSGGRGDRRHAGASGRAGPHPVLRHTPARGRARNRGRRLARGGGADRAPGRRQDRHGAEGVRQVRQRGPAADGPAARGRRDKLEVSPNLWAGVGQVRGGAGTALVGDPQEVSAQMREYMDLGIDRFILSGYPHLEECYRFAELVFPLLPLRATTGNDLEPARNAGPFGEVIANVAAPTRRAAG